MQQIKFFSIVISLLALFSTTSYALSTDSQQPINVQANTGDLDNNTGVLVYRGNVIITQGSMKVMGHTVTIIRNKEGQITSMTSQGNPAYYEQKPSPTEPIVKSYAQTIQYQVSNKTIILLTNAKVIQKNNVFTGDKIVYNTQTKRISAGKIKSGATSEGKKTNRIHTTLYPEKKK